MAYATTYDETERRTPATYWLIGLCVAVFFVQETLVGDKNMAYALGYSPGDIASRSLWTLVTYMFVHANLVHLGFNMWSLWLFGPRVERAMGSSTFTWFYLWCGLGGWAANYMLERNGAWLIGASGAVLGVAVAFAARHPDEEIYLFGVVPMKAKWLVVFFALMNVVMAAVTFDSVHSVAYGAHIGGIVAALIYLHGPSAGSFTRLRNRIAPAPDYGDDTPRPVPRSSPRPRERERERDIDDIVAQSKAAIARAPRRPAVPVVTPTAPVAPASGTALDAVLDKIAAEGMTSLTPAEKLLLDEWSQRLKNQTLDTGR